jgi:hypothetical protein
VEASGCNLNRRIDKFIVGAGFDITSIEQGYGEGPKPIAQKGGARR